MLSRLPSVPRALQLANGLQGFPGPLPFRGFSSSSPGEPQGGDGGDSGDTQSTHQHFPRITSENPYQAKLERAEVARALQGLDTSTWSQLHLSPAAAAIQHFIQQPLIGLRTSLARPMLDRVSAIAETLVQREVEGSFSRPEFTEGTQLAVRGVLEQWGSRQWAQLRSVCSGRLVDRMQQSLVELEREHRLQLQGITVDQVTTELASCNLWLTEHVRSFDSTWAQEASANTSNSWLMSTVSVNAKLRVTCLPLGQGGQPQQQHQQVLTKQGAWLFVRGPLPRGFSSQLALPWRVLGWWG